MRLIDNGLIVLQNASDSNICSGGVVTGQILGDGTGGSVVASSTYGSISYQWQSSTIWRKIILILMVQHLQIINPWDYNNNII